MQLIATATDLDGFTRQVEKVLRVRDAADTTAPVVALDPALAGRALAAPDRHPGQRLRREPRHLDPGDRPPGFGPVRHARGAGGVAGRGDPGHARSGDAGERLLRAPAVGHRPRRTHRRGADRDRVRSAAKTGAYTREDIDFVGTLASHEVAFLRRYDSLATGSDGGFGPGWRLALRDVDLVTDLPATGSEAAGGFSPLRDGTRLVLTTPTGERIGFTFAPEPHDEANTVWFSPRWIADPGHSWQLESVDGTLQRAADRYYDLRTARPYNPAGATPDGAQYILRAADGTRYEINVARGITAIQYGDGARLTVSDSGIVAATGEAIRFALDERGRVGAAVAPDGRVVTFAYDDGALRGGPRSQRGALHALRVRRRAPPDTRGRGEFRRSGALRPGGAGRAAYRRPWSRAALSRGVHNRDVERRGHRFLFVHGALE